VKPPSGGSTEQDGNKSSFDAHSAKKCICLREDLYTVKAEQSKDNDKEFVGKSKKRKRAGNVKVKAAPFMPPVSKPSHIIIKVRPEGRWRSSRHGKS
jgi:hypothetical protein